MKLSVLLENSYLVLIFSALLLIGNANLWDYKLSHEFPYGYLASDAFQHQARAEAIKDAGNFRFEANYISHGFENAVGRYPPIIYHLAVIFSYLTKLEVYDSIYFIVFFLASLSAIIMYFVIKGLNKNVALLSLPLSLLIFSSPNYIGFTWGHWPSMLGQFFLIALGETAGGDQDLADAVLFERPMFDDGVDGFLLGFLDEPAGVDDDHLGARGIGGQLEAVLRQCPQHHLAVHLVFGAAEVDEADGGCAGRGAQLLGRLWRHGLSV